MCDRFPVTLDIHTRDERGHVYVLRDDLIGGTKAIYTWRIIAENLTADEFVYATTPEGGLQIALADACLRYGKRCVLFVAKRAKRHPFTEELVNHPAVDMIELDYSKQGGTFLSRVQAAAEEYCAQSNGRSFNVSFGADYAFAVDAIAERMQHVSRILGREPEEVFCSVGSGMLIRGIIKGTQHTRVTGVLIGKEHGLSEFQTADERVRLLRHHLKYQQASRFEVSFPCNVNYERKAFEYCLRERVSARVLFWNVFR